MNRNLQSNLENLALAGELGRQLCHDFNNFLYNLFLQIEISRTGSTPANAGDWDSVRRAGDKIVARLREWDHFHRRFSIDESAVDLCEVIRQVCAVASTTTLRMETGASISEKPVCIQSSPLDVQHLLRLLVEDAFDQYAQAELPCPTFVLDAFREDSRAWVRIAFSCETSPSVTAERGQQSESLMAATCRSLAVRLGATISRQRTDHRNVIDLRLPSSLLSVES